MSAPGFDWPAMMRAGMGDLGLPPEAFWTLTPAELLLLLGPETGAAPLRRDAFEALLARFPDQHEDRGTGHTKDTGKGGRI